MTLQQIRYAITIADTGSMNRSAEILFVSQPSLTSAIKELEREIGISIFLRTSKGVIPTNEGADFLMHARQVYQQYELLTDKYSTSGSFKRKFGVSTQHYSFAVKAFVETVKKYDTLDFEFAIRETKTLDVIADVGKLASEIGILYKSDYNRKMIDKLLKENELEFYPLISCHAFVYIWKGHPLAKEKDISLEQLKDYPRLSFEQGSSSSAFLAEEILSENDYPRMIKSNDRATQLNLMVGLNGYTLCSGIICEELNGSDFIAVPFREDEKNRNVIMEIGYIAKKYSRLSDIAENYIEEVKKYLQYAKRI
ncbi:MAG: LysR family transcriptional regulator [Oscillospiraceae bacterium]|nr:LysR family transcriptional regulator [Oscillospiraceae bacterium]